MNQENKITLIVFCLALLPGSSWSQQSTQPAPSKPASASKSKMTNADVIQLITGGLSEQVIIVSIRQATERDFDLTPTGLIALKKASVPDAVILAMQNGDTPVKPAAPSNDKAPKDDTVSEIKNLFQQRVTSESGGALTLSSFSKINGYEQELTKMYVLEWQAEILFQQQGWKPGDAIGGYWNNFGVMPAKVGLLSGSWQHYQRGAKVRLKGDCMLRKTEQGWRVEGLEIRTYQTLAGTGLADPASAAATTEPVSLEKLSATIDRGEEVVFKIRYTYSGFLSSPQQYDGIVTVSKAAVAFRPTIGATGFSVAAEKILELINEPQEANRIRLKIAIKNKKGDKEDKKDFVFYHPSTFINGSSVYCTECDNSMTTLYALLRKVRGETR